MQKTTTAIIGAGQCGLAMSYHLTQPAIDHVILERGDVGNSWRTQRWDSLRLLTPNWQSRLPGFAYSGADPDGFRTMAQTVDLFGDYARSISAPIQHGTTVTSVEPYDAGYLVRTDRGNWICRSVVIASGACNTTSVPKGAAGLPGSVRQVSPLNYRNPDDLEEGGVLIIGASATGVQLAAEIQASGRPVTLAVGEHVRVPRTYRGRDIKWWMDRTGILDQRFDEVDDLTRARRLSSLQIAGSREDGTLDLNKLAAMGVTVAGRMTAVRDKTVLFSGGLKNLCALADLKMRRLLDAFDQWAALRGIDPELPSPHRLDDTVIGDAPLEIDLEDQGIRTVIWATGFRPDYSWLNVPVLNAKGHIRHEGGVTSAPGLFALGLPLLRRRKSTLIDGAGDDAADIAAVLQQQLDHPAIAA